MYGFRAPPNCVALVTLAVQVAILAAVAEHAPQHVCVQAKYEVSKVTLFY